MSEAPGDWKLNYFNYFTEIEERFQKARGTSLFLLSPIDWALIESWKNAGIPLEAVLRGIDTAFDKWRQRKTKARIRTINSLAYCTQAVVDEAEAMAGVEKKESQPAEAPFSIESLRDYLTSGRDALRAQPSNRYESVVASLEKILAELDAHFEDLETLEQRLTAMEEKMTSIARAHQTEEDLFEARRSLDNQLRPYRGKMSAGQLTMLEKQYLDRHLLESNSLPRLSLFYVR
jgi:hypothetical protein